MSSLHLILIAESGRIERQTRQFIRTFRHNGGRLKDAPIWVYHDVRPDQEPLDPEIVEELQELGVALKQPEQQNLQFAQYPLANKIYALADAEEHLTNSILTWVDSDMLCFQEPTALLLPPEARVSARPEISPNLSNLANPYPGKLNIYWREIYKLAELKFKQYVWPMASYQGKKSYPYFNSGLMQVRLGYEVFTHARKLLDHISPDSLLRMLNEPGLSSFEQGTRVYFFEQAINSACLLRSIDSYHQLHQLPFSYNMPLAEYSEKESDKPVHLLHYHQRERFRTLSFQLLQTRLACPLDLFLWD